VILVQSNFTNVTCNDDNQDGNAGHTPSPRTISYSTGITAISNQFFVTDQLNHRVLIYQGQ